VELTQKADHIRKHGRNNWPFCELYFHKVLMTPTSSLSFHSLSSHLSLHPRRNTRGFAAAHHAIVSAMAGSTWHITFEHGCMSIRVFLRHEPWQ
jgi:hypothetical protein